MIGDVAKLKIRNGVPDSGMLDPRWEATEYVDRFGAKKISQADVTVEVGKTEPEVLAEGRGTSLHDVSGWFGPKEFFIPAGTEYSDEITIVKDANVKWNPKHTVSGYHYQMTPCTRMSVSAFHGYLDNMARAAVVLHNKVGKTQV